MNKYLIAVLTLFSVLLVSCGGSNKEIVLKDKPCVYVDYSLKKGETKFFSLPLADSVTDKNGKEIMLSYYGIRGENVDDVKISISSSVRHIQLSIDNDIDEPIKINELLFKGDNKKTYVVSVDINITKEEYVYDNEPLFPEVSYLSPYGYDYYCSSGIVAINFKNTYIGEMDTISMKNKTILYENVFFNNPNLKIDSISTCSARDNELFFLSDYDLVQYDENYEQDLKQGFWIIVRFSYVRDNNSYRIYSNIYFEINYCGENFKISRDVYI